MRSSRHCPGEWQEEAGLGWVKGGRMRNAEAQVCQAAGPRREAPWGAGGQAVGEVCLLTRELWGKIASYRLACFGR